MFPQSNGLNFQVRLHADRFIVYDRPSNISKCVLDG